MREVRGLSAKDRGEATLLRSFGVHAAATSGAYGALPSCSFGTVSFRHPTKQERQLNQDLKKTHWAAAEVPAQARWEAIRALAKQADIGVCIDSRCTMTA